MHRINPDGSIPTDNPTFNQAGRLALALCLWACATASTSPSTPSFRPHIRQRERPRLRRRDEPHRSGLQLRLAPDYPCDDNAEAAPTPPTIQSTPCGSSGRRLLRGPHRHHRLYRRPDPRVEKPHLHGRVQHRPTLPLHPNADRTLATSVAAVHGVTANMDIETGPDGALWYMEGGGYSDGTLRRLVGSGPAQATATSQPAPVASPTVGTSPSVPGTGSQTFPETGKTVQRHLPRLLEPAWRAGSAGLPHLRRVY